MRHVTRHLQLKYLLVKSLMSEIVTDLLPCSCRTSSKPSNITTALPCSKIYSANGAAFGKSQMSNCFTIKDIRSRPESAHSFNPTKIGILSKFPFVLCTATYLRKVVLPAPGLPKMKRRVLF